MARRAFPRPKPHGQPQAALTSRAVRLLSLVRNYNRSRPCPTDGYHLPGCIWGNGPAGPRKVARRTRNSKHDRRGERQMPDPGRQHRVRRTFRPQPNNPVPRQAPAWAPFTFQGLSCQLRRTAHGRFVKARPARPTSTHLRSCRACLSPTGGSIVALSYTLTGPR